MAALADFLDGLAEQADIEIVSDFRDVPALFGPEDIAGAADFHVAHGDLHARAEFGRFLNRIQPRLRFLTDAPCGACTSR